MRSTLTPISTLALVALVGGLAAGCSSAPGDEASSQQQTFALSPAAPAFYSVAPGVHGGFELTSLNTSSKLRVTSVDYSGAGLDAATIEQLGALPTTELVLEGTASSGKLVVSTAYRGMPGMTFTPSATFYEAGGSTAHALNESVTRRFESVDVSAAAAPYAPTSWMSSQVSKGALVAGEVTQGAKVLTAQQVFIALPYVGEPCLVSGHICPDATPVSTYTRDASLCLDFAGCGAVGICPDFIPECRQGYTMTSWRGGAEACMQYACDPSFLHGS
jgi:hypothetical protein